MRDDCLSLERFWKELEGYGRDLWGGASGAANPSANTNLSAEFLESIDSTNTELLRRLGAGLCKDRFLLAAESQTNGHGRVGRKFYSPQNDGLYFSYTCRFDPQKRDISFYTVSAAVGVCRAVKKLYGEECAIKWVNDIFLGGKKIAGILAEGFVSPQSGALETIVTGIGINLRLGKETVDSAAPGALQTAGGIEDFAKKGGVSRTTLLASCIAEIFSILDGDTDSAFMREYKERSMLTGKTVTVTSLAGDSEGRYSAKVLGISDDAGLVVQTEDGSVKTLRSGEVSLHGSTLA